VILFNYRGYGRSTGTPTPSRNCDDLAALIRALKLQAGGKNERKKKSLLQEKKMHALSRCSVFMV
jgi:hypothetical protein